MDWPPIIWDAGQYEAIGENAATSAGTVVTANAVANTKGSYVELVASSAFNAAGLLFAAITASTTSKDFLIDIAVGAAGSEKVVAPNLLWSIGFARNPKQLWLPLSIPAGSRVSARCQCTTGGTTVTVLAHLIGRGNMLGSSFQRCTDIGAATGDSGGVSIDPGAVAHTKGAYSELVASCTNPVRGLAVALGNQTNGIRTNANFLLDIAIGAAAAEKVIFPDFAIIGHSADDNMSPAFFSYLPCSIPVGTRIAARAQCEITDATDRLFDLVLYGLD